MLTTGYFLCERDIEASPMFSDPALLRCWFYLRINAAYEAKEWRGIPLAVGDVLISHRRLAGALDASTGAVGRWLAKLEKLGEISVKAGRDYTVINVSRSDISVKEKYPERGADRDTDRDASGDANRDAPRDADRDAARRASRDNTKEANKNNQAKENTPLPPKGEPAEPKAMDCPAMEQFPEEIRDQQCRTAWQLWLAYKRKTRQPYKHFDGQLKQLAEAAGDGRAAFLGALNQAMRREWRGVQLKLYRENLAKGEITADGEPAKGAPIRQSTGPPQRQIVSMSEALATLDAKR